MQLLFMSRTLVFFNQVRFNGSSQLDHTGLARLGWLGLEKPTYKKKLLWGTPCLNEKIKK